MTDVPSRFFSIIGCYLDDDRLAACAICEFTQTNEPIELIYYDILSGNYSKWIESLEQIAENIKWLDLKDWCLKKQFQLDMMNSKIWSAGDMILIEKISKRGY